MVKARAVRFGILPMEVLGTRDAGRSGQGRRPVRARPHGSYQDGPTGVGFLIDGSPMYLEGTMSSRATEADAFGGCPDHFGCDQPRGGH